MKGNSTEHAGLIDKIATALHGMYQTFAIDALKGCDNTDYTDWQNGDGEDVGAQMNEAIKDAKSALEEYKKAMQ